jgi:hypothetical protein
MNVKHGGYNKHATEGAARNFKEDFYKINK